MVFPTCTLYDQTASEDSVFGSDVVEAGALTSVDVVASAYDARQGDGSVDGAGCGEDGCLPWLTRDGIVANQESRWSCAQDIVPRQGGCELEFTFGRLQDLVGLQISFLKADERDRWLEVSPKNCVYCKGGVVPVANVYLVLGPELRAAILITKKKSRFAWMGGG